MIINRNTRVVRTSQSNRLTFLTKENELPQKKGGGRNIHGNTGNKPTMKRKKKSRLRSNKTHFPKKKTPKLTFSLLATHTHTHFYNTGICISDLAPIWVAFCLIL